MQPTNLSASRYDHRTIVLHWTVAILVAAQWLGAQAIDFFPRGPLRVDARSLHITFGVVLGLVLVARIYWRATGGRRLPQSESGALHVLAKATHWGLYALLIAMVAVGVLLTWARGDSLFNLYSIPALSPGDKELPKRLFQIHDMLAWVILAVAGFHALAALIHHYVWRDGLLLRMMPKKSQVATVED